MDYDQFRILKPGQYDAIVLALAHDQVKKMTPDQFKRLGKEKHVLCDLKYVLDQNQSDIRL